MSFHDKVEDAVLNKDHESKLEIRFVENHDTERNSGIFSFGNA